METVLLQAVKVFSLNYTVQVETYRFIMNSGIMRTKHKNKCWESTAFNYLKVKNFNYINKISLLCFSNFYERKKHLLGSCSHHFWKPMFARLQQLLFAPLDLPIQEVQLEAEYHLQFWIKGKMCICIKLSQALYQSYILEIMKHVGLPDRGFNGAILMSKISDSISSPAYKATNSPCMVAPPMSSQETHKKR